MKKLLLLICLCVVTGVEAVGKRDLVEAIRAMDASCVERIIASVTFTSAEQKRYLDLAEEMVVERKAWMNEGSDCGDITTPYEGPSIERMLLVDLLGAYACLGASVVLLPCLDKASNKAKGACYVGICAGIALLFRLGFDIRQKNKMLWKRAELLRKKYENAVTVKQLILDANIVEA